MASSKPTCLQIFNSENFRGPENYAYVESRSRACRGRIRAKMFNFNGLCDSILQMLSIFIQVVFVTMALFLLKLLDDIIGREMKYNFARCILPFIKNWIIG